MYKRLMGNLICVSRTRERQASKGSIMWPTRSSRDLDWRLSFRSVTASVWVHVEGKSCGKTRRLRRYFCVLSYNLLILSVSTGSYWLCELSRMEWTRGVSLQNLKFHLVCTIIVWPGMTGWVTSPYMCQKLIFWGALYNCMYSEGLLGLVILCRNKIRMLFYFIFYVKCCCSTVYCQKLWQYLILYGISCKEP